jgi:hypothetical protein
MSRIVFTGTEENLYRLRPEDLPTDGSLVGSFFKHVDLSGHNLSDYDMRFVSTADCVAHNVILPEQIEYLYSRRTDWAGTKVPPLVSSLNHDLVLEVMRHHTAKPGTPELEAIEWVIGHVAASYLNSWTTAIWHLVNVMGLTREQVWEYFSAHAFAGYQRCLNRLKSELVGTLREEPLVYNATELVVQDPTPIPPDVKKVYGVKTYSLPFSVLKSVPDDIWGAARAGEQYLEQQSGMVGWKVVVFSLEPYVLAEAAHSDLISSVDNWWARGMGK